MYSTASKHDTRIKDIFLKKQPNGYHSETSLLGPLWAWTWQECSTAILCLAKPFSPNSEMQINLIKYFSQLGFFHSYWKSGIKEHCRPFRIYMTILSYSKESFPLTGACSPPTPHLHSTSSLMVVFPQHLAPFSSFLVHMEETYQEMCCVVSLPPAWTWKTVF